MCPSDADLTTSVHIRVLKGGCSGGESVYEATLVRGDEAPEDVIPEGSYGLEVRAFDANQTLVAEACKEQKLPVRQVDIRLASLACELGLDVPPDAGGKEPEPDADVCPSENCPPVASPCTIADPGDCTCVTFENHSYLFCPETLNWTKAREACRNKGTDLVVIDHAAENAFLVSQALGMSRWTGANDRGNNGSGTGLGPLCDDTCRKPGLGGAQEGIWKWVDPLSGSDRGATFCEVVSNQDPTCAASSGKYTQWAADEPNNVHANKCQYPGDSCDEGEDCGVIGPSGNWEDTVCSAKLPFICETF